MKLSTITTSNFLGARAVELHLTKAVALIAGKNGAGKSSIQEAVRMALTGEPVRVDLKKNYPALLTEGAEAGFADVMTDQSQYSIILPGGKGVHCETAALPYVIDAQRFAHLDDNARRQFLFGLCGVKLDGPTVKQRLLDKGCAAAKVEQAAPLLRAGFDAAAKEAGNKARDAKAGWKTATGGETWGKEKAPKWEPPALEFTAEKAQELLVGVRNTIDLDDADIGALQQEIGAARAEMTRRQQGEARRLELKTKADQADRIKARLDHDTAELVAWEQKVANCRDAAGIERPDPKSPGEFLLRGLATVTHEFLALTEAFPEVEWPGDLVRRAGAHLNEFRKLHGDPIGHDSAPDPEAAAKLPEYENALKLMQSAVANGQRDLDAANAAQSEYDKVVADQAEAAPNIEGKQSKLNEITARRDNFRADERKYLDMARQAAGRAALVEQVAKLHADVIDWIAISDALSPDGIPAELLAEALGPINARLARSGTDAEWPQVTIHDDMRITYGMREYALVSESEKWRTDAMIAEAVSHISGMKLLVLDRFDVLDMKGREDALYWLDGLAQDGEIDTALVFGTLKAIPAQLLPSIEGFWIENGTINQLKEAA